MPKFLSIFIFLCFFAFASLFAQDSPLKNEIFSKDIKTVEIYKSGFRFAYPVIRLNSSEQIVLEFDDLNNNPANYSYTIIHCDADFYPSDLNPIEYIDGYEENPVDDYTPSFNTRVSYNHYTLTFPNENIRPLLSGNYILLIYSDYDKENPVLQRRFSVLAEQCLVDGEVRRSSLVEFMHQSQEISFTVTDNSNYIENAHDNLNVVISQNNRPDVQLSGMKPDFIKGNVYEFLNPRDLFFPGGNEFRYFNIKNYRYTNDRVVAVSYQDPYYIFSLYPEKSEAILPYSYIQDINGQYLITTENGTDASIESEYVLVDFSLRYPQISADAGLYVFGALTDFEISEENKLQYNYTTERYELRMMLKQGFYNYEYVFVEKPGAKPDHAPIEGNFSETENNYEISVYYRRPGTYYDALIGYKIINSIKR